MMVEPQTAIRVGFVGSNHVGRVLIPAFLADGRAIAYAIASRDLANARRVAEEFQIPKVYDSWPKLIADDELDAVVIATPPDLQPAIALTALAKGRAVFLEKPVSVQVIDAQRVYDAAVAANLATAVDFIFPEIAAWRACKQLLLGKSYGALRRISMDWRLQTYSNGHRIDSWKARTADGGGALFNFGSHAFHAIEWLAGPISRLSAKVRRADDDPRDGDSAVDIWAELACGADCRIHIDTDDAERRHHEIRFEFDHTHLMLRNQTADYVDGFKIGYERSGAFEPILTETCNPERLNITDGRIAATAAVAARFLAAVGSGGSVFPNAAEGLRTQILLDCAMKSYDQRVWIDVPDDLGRTDARVTR